MKKFTVILIIICVAIVGLYGVIAGFAPQKSVVNTTYLTPITVVNSPSEEKKFFMEVNYYTNEYEDGYRMFELKINSYADTDKTTTKAYGIQLVDLGKDGFHFGRSFVSKSGSFFGDQTWVYDLYFKEDSYYYNTSEVADEISYKATDPIDKHTKFYWDIQDTLFEISFQNEEHIHYYDYEQVLWAKHRNYFTSNYVKFMYDMLGTISSMKNGTYYSNLFFFEDLFNYSVEVKSTVLGETTSSFKEVEEISTLVDVSNYDNLQIKINKSQHGAQSYNDSLFGIVANNSYWMKGEQNA